MRKDISYVAVLGLIIFGMVLGVILVSEFNGNALSVANGINAEEPRMDDPQDSIQNETHASGQTILDWADIAEKAIPSVVSIYTTKEVKVQGENPLYFFFHPDQKPQERTVPQKGLGSGAIVSKDGYILTNNHVAGDADDILVRLTDKREFKAKLIGKDPLTDLAVIKIEADDLPYLKIGNSDNLRLGEPVLAIGNPLDLTSTVTSGIVSAMGRNIRIIQSSYGIEDFIQTDAVINPGNSGGPLLNTHGEIIGVNSAIQTTTGYYQGYGFAVPSSIAQNVMQELIKYGRVKRGYIGIQIRSVDAVVAKGVGLDKPRGVLVESVQKGMPAEEAGLLSGDVVLQVNGKDVNEPNELQTKISSYNPGDKVTLSVWRNEEKIKIDVNLKERQGGEELLAQDNPAANENIDKLGIKVSNLTAEQKKVLEVDHGVWISQVNRSGQAAARGMMEHMVILQVNSKEIKNVSGFMKIVEKAGPGDVLVFKVRFKNQNDLVDRLIFVNLPNE